MNCHQHELLFKRVHVSLVCGSKPSSKCRNPELATHTLPCKRRYKLTLQSEYLHISKLSRPRLSAERRFLYQLQSKLRTSSLGEIKQFPPTQGHSEKALLLCLHLTPRTQTENHRKKGSEFLSFSCSFRSMREGWNIT